MTIPAGFMTEITTWENDGDNYKTQSERGLTHEQVELIVGLAERFKSAHNIRGDKKNLWNLGNEYHSNEVLVQMFEDVCKQKQLLCPIEYIAALGDEDAPLKYISEFLYEKVLGSPDEGYYSNEGTFCRVVETIKVFAVPQEIHEVTNRFMAPKE